MSGLEGSDALLAVRFVRHLGLDQNTVYIFSTGFICRMRRRLLKCLSQVSIWANVNIDAALMVWERTVFHTKTSRLRGQLGQQVHRVQMNESSPMLRGNQAHSSGSYGGGILCCLVLLGSIPKTNCFGCGSGLIQKPLRAQKNSKIRCSTAHLFILC